MKRYRKKPVVIEAVQFDETNGHEIEEWAYGKPVVTEYDWEEAPIAYTDSDEMEGLTFPERNRYLDIVTLEGTMVANLGDWIIKGVKGEFYPCKPSIFEETYEPVDD